MPYLYVPPVNVGPLTIHAFGVIAALAVLLGIKATRHRAAELHLDVHIIDQLMPWLVLGVFAGAHLISILFYFPYKIVEDPFIFLRFWDGLSSFGGILGGLVVAFIFLRRMGVKMKHYSQALLFGAVVSLLVGRIGCSIAHDHPGKVTTCAVAVKGWPTEDTPKRTLGFYTDGPRRHDLGLYEFLFLIPVTAILYALKRFEPFENFHIVLVIFMYAPIRFLLDFLRASEKLYFGLTPGQYFAIVSLIVAVFLIFHKQRNGAGPPSHEPV